MLHALAHAHVARAGAPSVSAVDGSIFTRRYFGHCMACVSCGDSCCQYGVDVDVAQRDLILARASELEPLVGVSAERWFEPATTDDPDFPSGHSTRTAVIDGACVFLNRRGRGCLLHSFALSGGEDYHELKPMVSTLFPVTFGEGALLCADELVDGSLICLGEGPTAYEMARAELAHYFGPDLVNELDLIAERLRQEAERVLLKPS